ncbi:MAG: hypothetical protein ACLSFT_00245 [Ruminococcus callidus]
MKLILIDTFAQTDPPQPPRYFVPEVKHIWTTGGTRRNLLPALSKRISRFPNSI